MMYISPRSTWRPRRLLGTFSQHWSPVLVPYSPLLTELANPLFKLFSNPATILPIAKYDPDHNLRYLHHNINTGIALLLKIT